MLVRLRDLPREEVDTLRTLSDPASLADRVWALKLPAPPALADRVRPFHDPPTGRLWQPVWLLDGLDELPAGLLDARFFRLLADLPGRTCVTCRTAVAQSERERLTGCVAQAEPYELLPLSPAEQEAFLAGVSGMDGARAKALHDRVRRHAALRPLAGNPLMLELLAEVAEREELPGSRAEFYRLAIGTMWRRRLDPDTAERWRGPRETVLTALAARIELREVVFELEHLDAALASVPTEEREPLRKALRTSGLLRFDDRSERAEFLHLTFQEYFLARKLKEKPIGVTLKERWADPRYEETLALLLALAAGEGRKAEVDAALRELIGWGLDAHRQDRQTLWDLGRSPLRTVLHLLGRSGIDPAELRETRELLDDLLARSPLLREAEACDRYTPGAILASLAKDAWLAVRVAVADNPSTPEATLIALSRAEDRTMRRAAPAEMLDANDPSVAPALAAEPLIRRCVAANPSTPSRVLEAWARGEDSELRAAVATNPSLSKELLASLADDDDPEVRRAVASNMATPQEVLSRLYSDGDPVVRARIAERADAPLELVEKALDDECPWVRRSAARNPALRPDRLSSLSLREDVASRAGVAANPSADGELLARLAADRHWFVRSSVAANIACPRPVMHELAADPEWKVREALAHNPSAPIEVLRDLAERSTFAAVDALEGNPNTAAAMLGVIAEEPSNETRLDLVTNQSLLLEDLALYAPAEQADRDPR